ncbi:MAG: type II toxin-antitoxin system RelE/ParE family toxin [Gallionellaceae bacterium]|nr:type II toxin-antitoxin system RelE/ParE family toxin [Gallionellaceae bacterium]
MRVEFSLGALHDLESIGDFIAQDSPHRAKSYVKKLRGQCNNIAQTPLAFRLRTELGANIRSSAYGNYVIFYCADENVLRIVRILHGSMDIEAQFQGEQQ